jgi:hypothetical protein
MTFMTHDSRVADIIYSFLNCVIFFNIYSELFYQYFFKVLKPKETQFMSHLIISSYHKWQFFKEVLANTHVSNLLFSKPFLTLRSFCVFYRLVENWDFTVKFQKLTTEKSKLQMNGLDHLISWSWGLWLRVSFLAGPIKILSTKPLACVRNSWLCCEFLSRCLMVFTGSSTRESQVGIWQQQWY